MFWGSFTGREMNVNHENIQDINLMLSRKEIKPLISKTFPMHNAIDAISMIGNRGVIGKVVLLNN